MIKYSNVEIQKFIKTFNLRKYLDSNKIEYKENSSEQEQYIIHKCPFCNNINYKGNVHPNRFYIGQNNKKFICYNCSTEGSLLKFLSVIDGLTLEQIFDKYFGKEFYQNLPNELKNLLVQEEQIIKEEIELKEITLPKEIEPLFKKPNIKYKEAYEYCLARGILNKDIGQKLEISYSNNALYITPMGKTHYLGKRIIFPIRDEKERIVGFTGRDITGNSQLKYYISESFPKTQIIYNYKNVFNADTITIVEGVIDLIKCWNFNPICLFGKRISDKQLILLRKMPNLKNIIVALDPDTKVPDKNGEIPYKKMIDILRPFWNILEVDIPMGKDAGDYSISDMNEILSKATPYKETLTSLID